MPVVVVALYGPSCLYSVTTCLLFTDFLIYCALLSFSNTHDDLEDYKIVATTIPSSSGGSKKVSRFQQSMEKQDINLQAPRVRSSGYFSSLLNPVEILPPTEQNHDASSGHITSRSNSNLNGLGDGRMDGSGHNERSRYNTGIMHIAL